MKKLLQKTIALAIAAVTLVASTVVVAHAEEEKNLAPDASYTIVRLKGLPVTGEEDDKAYFHSICQDNSFSLLNDGNTAVGETDGISVDLAGTGYSHRIKFDLGAEKTVTKVVLKNMRNTYVRADADSGKPAGNRGYQLDGFAVLTGDDVTAMAQAVTDNTEAAYEEDANYFIVTLTLKEAVETRYLFVDVQTTQPGIYGGADDKGAYIVTLDEVEIYGADAAAAETSETKEETTEAEGDASATADDASASAEETTETEAVNENAVYDLDVSAPKYVKAGEKVNVVISVKNIKAEKGLQAVAFTLGFDKDKVTPDVVSDPEDLENCEMFNDLITKAPQYTMSASGVEVDAPAWTNISRSFDGYYEFKFLDKMEYAFKKSGTTVDPILHNDDDLVITVPFTVNADVADGEVLTFTVSEVGGTAVGEDQPYSIEGNGGKAVVNVGEEVVEPSETDTGDSETEPADSETEPTATKPDTTPKTGDANVVIFFVLAAIALAGVVVFKKVRD